MKNVLPSMLLFRQEDQQTGPTRSARYAETVGGVDDDRGKGKGRGQSRPGREGRSKWVLDTDETTRNRTTVLLVEGRPSGLLPTANDVVQNGLNTIGGGRKAGSQSGFAVDELTSDS